MGVLLNEGIGDTIRVSLTPRPGGDRREEVYAACELLQALGLRSFSPSVTACPGCGRTTSSTFQELSERIQDYIRDRMPEWKTTHEGVETMTLAVMGCVVNGPGESKAANIGISLPGTGEEPSCPVYIDGRHVTTLRGTCDELAAQGYLALSPDLFWRQEPGVDMSDQTDAEWKKGFALYSAFDFDKGHAGGRLERTSRRVLKRLTGPENRLLADDALAFHVLGVAGGVGDDPVAREQLHGHVAFVGNPNGVVEEPLLLERLRVLGSVLRLDLHAHAIRDSFGAGRVEGLIV